MGSNVVRLFWPSDRFLRKECNELQQVAAAQSWLFPRTAGDEPGHRRTVERLRRRRRSTRKIAQRSRRGGGRIVAGPFSRSWTAYAQLRGFARGGPWIEARQHSGCPHSASARAIRDGRSQAAVLSLTPGAGLRFTRSCIGDGSEYVTTLRRHPDGTGNLW